MRGLKTKDVFKMSKILKKIDIEIDADGKTQEQMGAELILRIAENLHVVEKEVNDFVGDLIGMTGKEFNEMDLSETLKYFEQFKSLPGIDNFFKLAGKQNEK